MVFRCTLCSRKYSKECGIKFFRFPKNESVRNEWLIFCGFDLHPGNDTSSLKLCSEHFEKSSFQITRENGPLILKPDSIPSLLGKKRKQRKESVKANISMNPAIKTEDDSLSGTSLEIHLPENNQSLSNFEIITLSVNPNFKSDFPGIRQVSSTGEIHAINLSNSTDISYDTNGNNTVDEDEDPLALTPTKRKIWEPRDAMEMSPSDFDTPSKAQRNLAIIKDDITKKDERIKQLIQKTYRMRKKIKSLESMVEYNVEYSDSTSISD